ncbi:MAG: hypothetical protein ACI87W_002592 [Halieaceae bacterium]|jgi:hypothetical protein
MKAGIMQPYLFPYIGYFQLLCMVDRFVVYDDVQWSRGGWINRNRILIGGEPKYFTLPVRRGNSKANICEQHFTEDFVAFQEKVIHQIRNAYRGAPFYEPVCEMLTACFSYTDTCVSRFVANTLEQTCTYLRIDTPLIMSSSLQQQRASTSAEARVIDTVKAVGASDYVNTIGGIELYDKERFQQEGLQLFFLKPQLSSYPQGANQGFHPALSIIDVMMFNSPQLIVEMLGDYELV